MIKKHYAIFDTTAQNFMNTLAFQNHGEAIRWFTTQVNGDKNENLIAKYPTQFMLFHMFDIDDKTGMVGSYNIEKQEMEKQQPPRELIIGAACIDDESKAFTVKELITMLEAHFNNKNVVELTKEAVN